MLKEYNLQFPRQSIFHSTKWAYLSNMLTRDGMKVLQFNHPDFHKHSLQGNLGKLGQ